MDSPVLLTVRGTVIPKTLDAARILHNETAGSAAGMEAARSLSDLSHCVYVPVAPGKSGKLSDAQDGELLFLDRWADPAGLQQFFSAKEVQEQGGKMFSRKDASVWMEARGGFSFHVPATQAKPARYVGLFRAPVTSAEAAVASFGKMVSNAIRVARRRGQLSHELFVKLGPPDEQPEIIGVDMWSSLEGLVEHYGDKNVMTGLDAILKGAPQASVWEQGVGFNEW